MRRVAIALLALVCAPHAASAQTPLSELLTKLLLSDIILAPPSAPGFPSHSAHFLPAPSAGEVVSGFNFNQVEIPLAINSTIVSQISTIPVGSSSGGFSYTFDPSLGTFSRQSSSFGSAFAERSLTAGRGRWNLGFTFQRATYDTLEGKKLNDGSIHVYLTHQDCCAPANAPDQPPQPFFEGDLIANRLYLTLTASTFTAFVNYGITDRIDVGVTVPVVTVNMEASSQATVLRLATADIPAIHSFDGQGSSTKTFSEKGRAEGLGDLLLRTKYRFFDVAHGGLAVGVDLRLPTGDSEQLLGGGHFQARTTFIGSMAQGPFSPHVNVGYTFSTGKNAGGSATDVVGGLPPLPDEFSYAIGFDAALHERLTVSADVLGRSLRSVGRLVTAPRTFSYVTSAGTFGTANFEEFLRQPGDLDLTVGAIGARFNPRGNFLISAELLVPLTSAGLRDRVTPVIGVDYSF